MGKAPTFILIKSTTKQRERELRTCRFAILEPSRLQTVQRTKPVRKDHKRPPWAAACRNFRKPPNSSWPNILGTNGKNWSGFQHLLLSIESRIGRLYYYSILSN